MSDQHDAPPRFVRSQRRLTMASDPVAEALRVAASRLQTDADIWCSDQAADLASTAIAAFLRALPGAVLPDHTGFNVVIPQSDLRAIAAAVERAAAREGRDGG